MAWVLTGVRQHGLDGAEARRNASLPQIKWQDSRRPAARLGSRAAKGKPNRKSYDIGHAGPEHPQLPGRSSLVAAKDRSRWGRNIFANDLGGADITSQTQIPALILARLTLALPPSRPEFVE
jgi:hypothetical protein